MLVAVMEKEMEQMVIMRLKTLVVEEAQLGPAASAPGTTLGGNGGSGIVLIAYPS